ncbi:MAG: glycosyltransferase family 1 protein [Planctomycetes bacterium]|nr:glycosyltransferase family 1 protein [Planctomycetota bacterium]
MYNKPRICMFSPRHLQRLVSRCADYEFEDMICEMDDVEVFAPEPYSLFAVGQKLVNRLARYFSVASLNPGIAKLRLKRNYDLFFAKCLFASDLLWLNAIKGWKRNCRTSVCWLSEVWAGELHKWKGHLKILSQFDYVVLNCNASVQSIQDAIQRPCFYIPPGVDAILFCPYPDPPHRCINVYSLGRKSLVTHQSLLKMAEQGQIFYIYDTVPKMHTLHPRSHRSLVANIAKRSRYFIANAAKIDQEFETHGQSEIGYRFFEGAASGTVMIGEPPKNDAFRKHFDWPDAVIHVPYNTVDIANILADLDSQPEHLKKIRKNNVIQSLLRHDWVYRWRDILDIVGLEPRPALVARDKRLKKLAEDIRKTS